MTTSRTVLPCCTQAVRSGLLLPFALYCVELVQDTPSSRLVDVFLNTVACWPSCRWRVVLLSAAQPCFRQRRELAIAVRDAVIARERLNFIVWRAIDGTRTVIEMLPTTLSHRERQCIASFVRDAALALAARPALPVHDLTVLLGPFLPLQLPDMDLQP
jgi:hypothetical protein